MQLHREAHLTQAKGTELRPGLLPAGLQFGRRTAAMAQKLHQTVVEKCIGDDLMKAAVADQTRLALRVYKRAPVRMRRGEARSVLHTCAVWSAEAVAM